MRRLLYRLFSTCCFGAVPPGFWHTAASATWTPASITSLIEWHKYPIVDGGYDQNDPVTSWPDSKGSYTQTGATNKPLYDIANTGILCDGNNVRYFNGGGSTAVAYPRTIFAVIKWNGWGTGALLGASVGGGLELRTDGAGPTGTLTVNSSGVAQICVSTGTVSTTGKHLVQLDITSTTWQFYIDGAAAGNGTHAQTLSGGGVFMVGGDASDGPFTGDISELGICSAVISAGDRASLLAYSQATWGTP